tara:strand:- start:247 stop:705 length:459 start_codon:yes stop_codon:yes gene_type:complete
MKKITNNSLNTAGGIVFSENKILFIFKKNKWDLPKGKIGKNRSKLDTAIEEIYEETGVFKKNLKVVKKLVPTYYFKKINGKNVLKQTTWYRFNYSGDLEAPFVPALDENITHCEWVDIVDMKKIFKNTHERIKYIIDLFLVDLKAERKKQLN